jgi:hypothetical protein
MLFRINIIKEKVMHEAKKKLQKGEAEILFASACKKIAAKSPTLALFQR